MGGSVLFKLATVVCNVYVNDAVASCMISALLRSDRSGYFE